MNKDFGAPTAQEGDASNPMKQMGTALRFALRHFEVSTGIAVDPGAMASAFATGEADGDALRAATAHLREAETAQVADLLVEGSATVAGLKRLARERLPEGHRTRSYLDRLRS